MYAQKYKICKVLYAFFFFALKDLVQLVNADRPYWLVGMTEMTRTFGLELLESVLTNFSSVFFQVRRKIMKCCFSEHLY